MKSRLLKFVFATISISSLGAREIPPSQLEFFEKKIRPALIKHCYECHSEEGDKIKGGLLLDTRDAILQGGDSGPAVVPGNLHESLLYTAVSYEDGDLEMPPKYKLDETVIADFKAWIEMGAPDPRNSAAKNQPNHPLIPTRLISKKVGPGIGPIKNRPFRNQGSPLIR